MAGLLLVRNQDVQRVLIGVPTGHKHYRMIVELRGRRIVFEEATISSITRAFVWVKNHPKVGAIELRSVMLTNDEKKVGYAEYQLLETSASESEVRREIDTLLRAG